MADIFRLYICVLRFNFYAKILFGCLHIQWIVILSAGIWILETPKLQAATENSISAETVENGTLPSELNEQIFSASKPENFNPKLQLASQPQPSLLPSYLPASTEPVTSSAQFASKLENLNPEPATSFKGSSADLHYLSKPLPQLMAAPENFNPQLRLPPPAPPLPPASTSTEPVTPAIKLESLTTDFRRDADNFNQHNLFIEPTAQFHLRNGNSFRIKTGFNSFEERKVESVTNIPLHVEWEGKIEQVKLTVGGGVDLFDRLSTAVNFNAKAELPLAMKVSPSGQLQSGVIVSAGVEQGPYKANAQTLDNQITAWRFGPSIYWQIEPNTSLYSSLRLGRYNDGNFEQQSFSQLEHKLGQFSVAANVFNWSYTRNVQETSGYFSPPDFLVINGEVAWEGNVFESLRCRLATSLGTQRLSGKWTSGNSYQGRCTAKLSPNLEADFGYGYSNVRNRDTGGSAYNNQSFTGQLRVRF